MARKHPEVYVKINEEGGKVEWILDDSQKDHDGVYSVKFLADAIRERENVEDEDYRTYLYYVQYKFQHNVF